VAELRNPHGGEPVNDGEQRVVQALVKGLPDGYFVIPSLEIRTSTHTDEIDAVVVGPQIVVLIETKDYRKNVIFREREHLLDGERRPNPIDKTLQKARRFKGMLSNSAEALHRVWVVHQQQVETSVARTPDRIFVDDQRPAGGFADQDVIVATRTLTSCARALGAAPPSTNTGWLTPSFSAAIWSHRSPLGVPAVTGVSMCFSSLAKKEAIAWSPAPCALSS
jgi:hypothetical protein